MATILTIVGARPQFVKASVLRRLFDASPDFTELLLHTGQHYDVKMSDIFFDELEIREPDIRLGINGGGQGDMTGRMMAGIEQALLDHKPDACLVYGDTNSTLAGALAAAKLHIPVFHVEAGLRSFNKAMPEEINRILTDHVSELLFVPTQSGTDNLANEGITKNVFPVGDLMYDATMRAIDRVGSIKTVGGVDLTEGKIAACTLHRAENTDDPVRLQALFDFLNRHSKGVRIVLPLHPRTRKAIATHGTQTGSVHMIEPVGYLDMQALLAHSTMVFTDSGGLQKEAYFHGKPCITLRDETEWTELIEAGWNRLWTSPGEGLPIVESSQRQRVDEYGEGASGEAILAEIRRHLAR